MRFLAIGFTLGAVAVIVVWARWRGWLGAALSHGDGDVRVATRRHECPVCHTRGLTWREWVGHCDPAAWSEDDEDPGITRRVD
jgi:hypothetical protein